MEIPEEKRSLLKAKSSQSDEILEYSNSFNLKINSCETLESKNKSEFIFPTPGPHTKEQYSFAGEMINQGIETIEFVLGNLSLFNNFRICIKYCFLFTTLGSFSGS